MMRRTAIATVAALILTMSIGAPRSAAAAAPPPADFHIIKTITTLAVIDYITIDPQGRRAYVGRGHAVSVFDIDQGKFVGEVVDVPRAHGVAFAPGGSEGFATAGSTNEVVVFDLKTLKVTRRIKAGLKPDAIIYEPASKKIYVFNSNGGTVSIIDPASPATPLVTVEVGGTLEGAVSDGAGRVYVNAMERNDVAVIDTAQAKTIARWPVGPGTAPIAMAIDTEHHRLFVGCENKKLIILSTDDGKVLGEAPIGGGCDGLVFDPQTGLVFSANGLDGTLTVLREGPGGKFAPVQTLPTAKMARTIAMDPKTRNLYLPTMIPAQIEFGSFGLLVVGTEPHGAAKSPAPAAAR
ncbi:MAG TPA: hypothetical protein VGK32_17560 [Vicinamibacterales bacterium]